MTNSELTIEITRLKQKFQRNNTLRFQDLHQTLDLIQALGDTIQVSGGQDATTTSKGVVKLAGDLGGTADLPTVPGLATKANDNTVLHNSGNEIKNGDLTLNNRLFLPSLTANPGIINEIGVDETGAIVINTSGGAGASGTVTISGTNKTGVSIPKGSAVYISGAQGSKATLALALADPNVTTSSAIGITQNAIANNASGDVVMLGEISNIDTSAFSNGNKVYLSATIPGGLTIIPPTSPNNVVFIGTVTNSHATQGKIIVNVIYTTKLDRLVDVALLSPSDRQVLMYESSSNLWKNKSLNTADITTALGYIPENKLSKGIANGYASLDASGFVPLTQLPPSAIERLIIVANQTARFALTTATVQNGDTVKQTDTNIMYYVKDDTNLSNSTGYEDYKASTAASVPWSGVTGTPTTLAGYNITDAALDSNTIHKTGNETKTGSLTVNSIIRSGGLSTQFLKADGSIDNNAYLSGSRTLDVNGVIQDLNANRSWRTAQADTGILTFAGLTTNTSTTINIGAVTGYVIDNETTPSTPVTNFVNYAGQTNITVTTVGTGTSSYVMLNAGGAISFQNTFPTSAERKAKIWLGKVSHPAGAITIVVNEPDYVTSPLSFSRDLFQAMGPYINKGVTAYPNGANLSINITQGNITGDGINFVNSRTNPNILTMGPATAQVFSIRTQLGGATAGVTTLTPGVYDNAGVITAIGGGSGSSTIQYVFAIPGLGYIIQLGQTVYASLNNAVAALGKENFVTWSNLLNNAIVIGAIVVTKNATQLNDPAQAMFFNADRLGQLAGATSGTTTASLQSAYNNGQLITTSVANGAFTLKRGSATDNDITFNLQGGAGGSAFSITATGNVSAIGTVTSNGFVKAAGTSAQYLMADGSVTTIQNTATVVTGTTYTLLSTDSNKQVIFSSNTPVTITIPLGLPTGFLCEIYQQGTGQLSITVASGGLLRYQVYELPQTESQYSIVGLEGIVNMTDTYKIYGQLQTI